MGSKTFYDFFTMALAHTTAVGNYPLPTNVLIRFVKISGLSGHGYAVWPDDRPLETIVNHGIWGLGKG